MGRLDVDEGIQELVGKMWKHRYKTVYSCAGHDPIWENEAVYNEKSGEFESLRALVDVPMRYVAYESGTGDGWFEENAEKLGFVNRGRQNLDDPVSGERMMSDIYDGESVYWDRLANGEYELNQDAVFLAVSA